MGFGNYDAVLLVSFGGPERREDVVPFLENVLRGKRVPRQRLLEVAEHYYRFGGRSPLNDQNRKTLDALRARFVGAGPDLPLYWGNRNWHPLLEDTLRVMAGDGVQRALAFVTSAFSSYSGCRQYLENIEHARAAVGPEAPEVDKIRPFFNHPGFIGAMAARVRAALSRFGRQGREPVKVLFTAHSIPVAMARSCPYVQQLREASRLVSEDVGGLDWELVYQSRSGPALQPWLEPDICHRLRQLSGSGTTRVCIAPIGFLSDHLEVLYDLDTEAASVARELGMRSERAGTVGAHPRFVAAVHDLIAERVKGSARRLFRGSCAPCPDVCPTDCCPGPPRRPGGGGAGPVSTR